MYLIPLTMILPSWRVYHSHPCLSCFSFLVYGFSNWAYLVIVGMTVFDIILGMTCLSPYYIVLNWNTKYVTPEVLGRERLELEWVYKPNLAKVISSIRARNLLGRVAWHIWLILGLLRLSLRLLSPILCCHNLEKCSLLICLVCPR